MSPLFVAQLGPLLDQALDDGADGLSLLTRFEVRRDRAHVYDLTLFADEDGTVYRAGTLEPVASFSQGGATASDDAALLNALNAALAVWRSSKVPRPAPPTSAPSSSAPSSSAAPSGPSLPRYAAFQPRDHFVLGKTLSPTATTGLLRIEKPPTPAELDVLTTYLAPRAANFVVELGPTVPLSVLASLSGVRVVALAGGRKHWDGLENLPTSVRRLSIHRPSALTLAALPPDNQIGSLELDVASMPTDAPVLSHLETVAWTGAEDVSWLEKQPALRELALRSSKIVRLPGSPSLERLLLYKPSKLRWLDGIAALPNLRYLRIDHPANMQRLGSLAACRALTTMHITAAHRITDLSDLVSAPVLEVLGVSQSQLDAEPFRVLEGKLKAGSFQLKSNRHTKALQEHLAIPFVKTYALESHFFDAP